MYSMFYHFSLKKHDKAYRIAHGQLYWLATAHYCTYTPSYATFSPNDLLGGLIASGSLSSASFPAIYDASAVIFLVS